MQVEEDVKNILKIRGWFVLFSLASFVFRSPSNRTNLFYEVQRKSSGSEETAKFIVKWIADHDFSDKCGIVYAVTQQDTQDVADQLVQLGLKAAAYHAGLKPQQKVKVQEDWMAGRTAIVVATVAFGMGINKLDVRFVIHHGLPKTIESWYQESGRAGRDGKPSRYASHFRPNFYCLFISDISCLVLFRLQDALRLASIQSSRSVQFQALFKLCTALDGHTSCRRLAISSHFGEELNVDKVILSL